MEYAKEKVDIERSVYNWTIPNFSNLFQVLNQRKHTAHTGRRNGKEKRVDCSDLELVSDKFIRGQLVHRTSIWQLELRRSGTYLCVGLSCLECVHENCNEVWTRFDIDVVDFSGEVRHSQGSGTHFCSDNLTKFTPLSKIGNKSEGRPNVRCSFWETDAISIRDLTKNWNKLVSTNALKLRLRLYVYRDKPFDEASHLAEYHEPVLLCYTDSSKNAYGNPFLLAVKKAWESGEDADIIFEIEGEKINAHKFVVSVQSSVLKKMTEEAHIEIKDTPLPIFRQLLKYMYTQDAGELKDSKDIEYITRVLDACNLYRIPSLARICFVRLLLNMNVENFADIAFAVYSRVTSDEQSFFKTEVKLFLMENQKELQKSEIFQTKCKENADLFLQLCFQPIPLYKNS